MRRGLSSRARVMVAAAVTAIPFVGLVSYAAIDRYQADKARATLGATTRVELYAALAGEKGVRGAAKAELLTHLVTLFPLPPGAVLAVYGRQRFVTSIGEPRGTPPTDNSNLRAALRRGSGTFTARSADGATRVWGVASVEDSQSRLVYGRRGSDVYGSAQGALRRDILLAVLVSALGIGAAFVFASRMTAPIRRLAARVGDDRHSPNDIGALERGIDRLGRVIEESEVELARRAERLQQLNEGLEERVRLRTGELQRANDELEAFSYSVSHDLRAPLRAIDGFARIVLDDCADGLPADVGRYLQLISKNTQEMGQLIDGLLAFSRLGQQPLGKRTLDVESIAQEVASVLEGEHPGRPSEISIAALPEADADPTLVRQVFVNLLSNAIKYTRSTETPAIEVGSYQDNGWPVYLVRDNGVGFDMRYANKLFTVFQRLHRVEDYEGTGIGLALVARIVSRHGGRIWAEAKPDEGATFYFTLQGEAS